MVLASRECLSQENQRIATVISRFQGIGDAAIESKAQKRRYIHPAFRDEDSTSTPHARKKHVVSVEKATVFQRREGGYEDEGESKRAGAPRFEKEFQRDKRGEPD